MGFEARRDEICRRIRLELLYVEARAGGDQQVVDLVMAMERAATPEEFDPLWERFYDWADEHRVWNRGVPPLLVTAV